MEFSKSNRFNDDENQVNKNLVHYKGVLGEFDYDPRIWKIVDNHLMFKNKEVKSLPKNLELPKGCVDISYMFFNCKNLADISPLKNWDISNVKSALRMFSNCISLTNITTLQSWNTSKVENISHMFSYCINLKDISSLRNWDISKVKSMSFMFSGCVNLKDISPLENWNTSNVKSMANMFSYCVNLTDTSSLNKWRYFKSKKHI